MPQAIPLVVGAAAQGAGWGALATFLVTAGSAFAVGHYERTRAKSRARAAYNAQLQDRLIPIRSGVSARQYVLGTCRVTGTILYGDTVSEYKTALDVVTALAANKCTIIGHYLDDEYIPAADFPGEKFGTQKLNDHIEEHTITGPSDTVTLQFAPFSAGSCKAYRKIGSKNFQEVSFTLSGSAITFTGLSSGTHEVRVVYKALSGLKLESHTFSGSDNESAHSWGSVSTPLWTNQHRMRGIFGLRTLYRWDESLFAERGAPAHGAVAAGGGIDTHPFYDPRDGSSPAYTSNPALLAYWWATLPRNKGGCGIPSDWINPEFVAEAANVCDELMEVRTLDGEGYEEIKRYEFHGVLSTEDDPWSNLLTILATMNGKLLFTAGEYRMFAGAFRSATKTITDDDVVGTEPIIASPGGDIENPPNVVTATFADATNHYRPDSPRPVINADYVDLDGYEEPLDLNLPATTDPRQAHYLMGVELESRRPALGLSLRVWGIGEDLALGDCVEVDLSNRSAYSGKTFEVVERTDRWDGSFDIKLQQIRAQTWALDPDTWTPAHPIETSDASYLWDVADPTGFTVSQGTPQVLPDGTSVARITLSWDTPTQPFVAEGGQHNLRYRRMGDSGQWITMAPVPGDASSTTLTAALEDGDVYQFQIQAQNGIGARSNWVDVFTLIDGERLRTGGTTGHALNRDPYMLDEGAWEVRTGSVQFVEIADGVVGLGAARSSPGVEAGVIGMDRIPIDPAKSYRVSALLRTISGSGSDFYMGVAAFDAGGNLLDANGDHPGNGTWWYYAAYGAAPGTFTRYTGTFGNGTAKPFPANARTMAPLFILAYGGGTSVHEIQDLRIEEVSAAGLTVLLTNESHTVPASNAGVVSSYAGASGQFKVYANGVDVSSNFTLSTAPSGNPQDLTVSYSDQTYTVSGGLAAGTPVATLNIRATGTGAYTGYVFDRRFTLSKSLAGATGANAKLLYVIADRQTIHYDGAGNPSPSSQTITFTAQRVNTSAVVTWTVRDINGNVLTPTSSFLSSDTGNVVTMSRAQFDAARAIHGAQGVIVTGSITDGVTLTDSISAVAVHAGAAGASTFTLQNVSNMEVTTPSSVRKIAGGAGWTAKARTGEGFTQGASISALATNSTGFGLTTNPSVDANYTSVNYWIYFETSGAVHVYRDGANQGWVATWSGGDRFTVTSDNAFVRYFKNGTEVYSHRVNAPGESLFGVVNIYAVSDSVTGITFGPGGGADGRMIIGRGQCVVGNAAIQKIGGTTAWDSDAIGLHGYSRAHVRFKPNQTSAQLMVGLNSDPTTDRHYSSLDRAFYLDSAGGAYIYEHGVNVAAIGAYTTSTVFEVRYDGSSCYYFKNGILVRTVATSGTMYFDSSFYDPGAGIHALVHGPGTMPGQVGTVDLEDGAATDIFESIVNGPVEVFSSTGVATAVASVVGIEYPFDTEMVVTATGAVNHNAGGLSQFSTYAAVADFSLHGVGGSIFGTDHTIARNPSTAIAVDQRRFSVERRFSVPANTPKSFYLNAMAGAFPIVGATSTLSNVMLKVEVIKK